MRKPLITTLAAGLLLSWQANPIQAQFVPASTPDQTIAVPGSATNVTMTNTASVEIPLGGTPLQVMTWDGGSIPSFGWDYGGVTGTAPLLGNGIGPVRHPDIVTNPSATALNERVAIVYHINFQRVYVEVHQWNGFTFNPVLGPTLVSIAGPATVSHPNIDIFSNGRAIITWTENGAVKGRGLNLPAGIPALSGATFTASTCSGTPNNDRSDVAVFNPTSGGAMINFVYVANYGTAERLIVQRASFGQVWSGAAATCGAGSTNSIDGLSTATHQFGIPRIACPNRFISFMDIKDASVVCLKYTNATSNYEIFNYTHHANAYPVDFFATNSLNTAPANISNCGNKYPSISYVGRFIIATWTHDNCTGSSVLNGLDVVARQMYLNGVPWALFNTYSVVNQGVFGSQLYSAVDGKFSSAYNGFYTWADGSASSVEYKSSYFYNQSLREETVAEMPSVSSPEPTEFKAFPNPMTDNAVFQFDLADGEQGESLEIYDLSGRLIDRLPLTGLSSNSNRVEWQASSDMPAGVYLVRLVTDQRAESIRITKQ